MEGDIEDGGEQDRDGGGVKERVGVVGVRVRGGGWLQGVKGG